MHLFSRKKTGSKKTAASADTSVRKQKEVYKGLGTFRRMSLAIANLGLGKFRSPFIQNLAMMLGAGLHVNDALAALEREAKKGPMHKLIGKIRVDVDNGLALWRA